MTRLRSTSRATHRVQPRASPMAWAAARALASQGLAMSACLRLSNRV